MRSFGNGDDVASTRRKHGCDIQIAVRCIPLPGAVDRFLRDRALQLIRRPQQLNCTDSAVGALITEPTPEDPPGAGAPTLDL